MSNEQDQTPEPGPESVEEKIREIIEDGLPDCIKAESQDVIDAVMQPARSVLRTANPITAVQAYQWRGVLVRMLLHMYKTYGAVDVEAALVHDVIEDYINRVNKKETDAWKKSRRSTLRFVGAILNPQAWPKSAKLASHFPVEIYSEEEEAHFRLEGELACYRKKWDRAFVVVGSLGAGLSGPEMARVSPNDVVELTDGRLGIWVSHGVQRLVPVRKGYTKLLTDICNSCKVEGFIRQNYDGAVHNIGGCVIVKGLGRLSFSRGRATWLTAHLLAGTPLAALWTFTGPLSFNTLNGLLDAASVNVTPNEAALQGLKA